MEVTPDLTSACIVASTYAVELLTSANEANHPSLGVRGGCGPCSPWAEFDEGDAQKEASWLCDQKPRSLPHFQAELLVAQQGPLLI